MKQDKIGLMNSFFWILIFYATLCFFKPFRTLMGLIFGWFFVVLGTVLLFFATIGGFVAGCFVGIGNYLREGH